MISLIKDFNRAADPKNCTRLRQQAASYHIVVPFCPSPTGLIYRFSAFADGASMRVAAKLHANVQSYSHDSLTSAFKNSYIDPGTIISMRGKAAASPVCI